MRIASSRALLAIGVIACLIVLSQYHLIRPSLRYQSSFHPQKGSVDHVVPEAQIAILLQISPVDPNNRIRRLISIDQGWAHWLQSNLSPIDVYAPFLPSPHHLHNIRLFPIKGANPFSKMFEAFFWIVNNPSQRYDWLMFGNDHTFVIPQNLRCHLKALDSSSLIYTGNNLRITFQGRLLRFASGGAGAILSRPALLSILSVWTVLHSGMASDILQRLSPIIFSQESLYKYSASNLTIDLSDRALSDSQFFHRLLGWTLSNSLLQNQNCPLQVSLFLPSQSVSMFLEVRVRLSRLVSFLVTLSFSSQPPRASFHFQDSKPASPETLHQFCTCKTTWDHDNPGL
jgi:hypothetical protein